MNYILNQEPVLRLSVFMTVLILMLLWEALSPRRETGGHTIKRRLNNLVLMLFSTLTLRVFPSFAAVAASTVASEQGWGLFNVFTVPFWLTMVLCFLCLDLLIYAQHVLFHKIPILWRLHRVHHTDTEFDTTTGIRFHPIEIILSMCIKIVAVLLLGAPLLVVIIFEVVLNATSLFNHGNVRISSGFDKYLRRLIVTPDMHRVHHSVIQTETDSNFGFNLSCWDRLFGTYQAQPKEGHREMRIGLMEFRDKKSVNIGWLLLQPFLNDRK